MSDDIDAKDGIEGEDDGLEDEDDYEDEEEDVLDDIADTLDDVSETLEKIHGALTDSETGESKLDQIRDLLLKMQNDPKA